MFYFPKSVTIYFRQTLSFILFILH
jgi:hypothetical protein